MGRTSRFVILNACRSRESETKSGWRQNNNLTAVHLLNAFLMMSSSINQSRLISFTVGGNSVTTYIVFCVAAFLLSSQ